MAELMLPNFLGAYNQGVEARRQNALIQRQEMERQRAEQEASALRNYLQGADLSGQDAQNKLFQFGAPGAEIAQRLATVGKERKLEAQADLALKKQENDQKLANLNDMLNIVTSARSPAAYANAIKVAQAKGYDTSKIPQTFDPDFVSMAHTSLISAKDQAELEGKRLELEVRKGQLTVAQQREARLASQEDAAESQSIMGHDALVNAATRYNIDGTLPPLGMGKAGAKTRGAILDMAAELSKGIDPADQRLRQISTKANASALTDLSKREAQVGAFERNFVRNADIVEKMSTKMDQSGSPIIQKWINAGKKKVGGDPDIAALDVAIKAVVNEYGKIVSGSMGNTAVAQSEIKRMEDLLNNANTTEQVIAILNTMRQETDNRMVGFKEEKARLRGDISGKPAAAGAAAPAAPAAPTKPPGDKKPMRIGRFEVTPAG
jgi:hypothetical protein